MSINTIIALDKQNPRSYHSIEEQLHVRKKEPKRLFQITDHAIYFNTAFTDHIQKSCFSEDASTIYLKSQGSDTALEAVLSPLVLFY